MPSGHTATHARTPLCTAPKAWHASTVYQIYPRSFCDSNGDGVGDLPGITRQLPYLQTLGVDIVWLSPIYASPQHDNGYDISDYRRIQPEFGTMADFDALLAAMHARGLRLMMDLVVNHTSDQHTWFEQARSSRDHPLHDWYIWAPPQPDGSPPNNWEAAFQGPAWTWNAPTGEYYLHMFSPRQPDLNWENPHVRQAVHAIMRFWLDKGVDGFRMDVINMISKPWDAQGRLPDAPRVREGMLQPAFHLTCNGPRLGAFLADIRREVLDHYPGTLTVGEAPMATVAVGRELTHPKTGSLNMLFQFEHVDLDAQPGHALGKFARRPLDWRDMKASMARWQTALHQTGWNSLYFCNHDQPRSVSRWGVPTGALRNTSAKALATWLHGMQGTPYVYQGEELGMANVAFDCIDDYRDIESLNFYRVATTERGLTPGQALACIHAVGRDNARTPMQWNAGPQAGFTTGTPWIALNPDYTEVHAQSALAHSDSVFHHYRQLIALRKQHAVLREGAFELLWPEHPQLCGYIRRLAGDTLLVVANMGLVPVSTPWPAQLPTPSASCGTASSKVSSAAPTTPRCLLANLSSPPERWAEPVLHLRPFEALMLLFSAAQAPASA